MAKKVARKFLENKGLACIGFEVETGHDEVYLDVTINNGYKSVTFSFNNWKIKPENSVLSLNTIIDLLTEARDTFLNCAYAAQEEENNKSSTKETS